MPQYPILQPPRESFETPNTIAQNVLAERQAVYLTSRIEYTPQGIYRYNLGCQFPEKGFPTPEILASVNTAKRITMSLILPLAEKEMLLPLVGFGFLPFKRKIKLLENVLRNYIRLANQILSPCYLKFEYYNPFCKELMKFLYNFFYELGIDEEVCWHTAKVFTTLIEYDNAYRLRLEDLFYESKDLSRKDILRILKLYTERETYFAENGMGMGERFLAFGRILSLILYHPRIKKAFYTALSRINIQNLKMDEADSYYCLLRTDYKFFGEENEARIQRWYQIHNNILPPQILVNG